MKSLENLLQRFNKIAIAGVPKSGKTTLLNSARRLDALSRHYLSTDDFIGQPWEHVPALIIANLEEEDRYFVEGVMVGRALRKGLAPDVVVWMGTPRIELSRGQSSLAKGCKTIFNQWAAVRDLTTEVIML